MKRFIAYPSIDQFRTTIKNIEHSARYIGQDENDLPMYNMIAPLPTIIATATEKIHGTNAAVCYSNPDGFWVQSRNNIITPESDNAGCAFAAYQNQDTWLAIINELASMNNINLDTHIISVYYEWCGGNIQQNSAVSGLDKMAIIFKHFKSSPIEPDSEPSVWYETSYTDSREYRIYNINGFPTYDIEINFEQLLLSQNKMISYVEDIIEPDSPVGKQLGIDNNIGEGIVVSFMYKDQLHQFKVKGEKHSKSKVKTLTPVDNEHLQLIQTIAQQVTPAWRLEQMCQQANDTLNSGAITMQNIGKFLKLINDDIIKEESDVIHNAGLEPKDIFSSVARISKKWYQEQL